jgi:hypothetical protein
MPSIPGREGGAAGVTEAGEAGYGFDGQGRPGGDMGGLDASSDRILGSTEGMVLAGGCGPIQRRRAAKDERGGTVITSVREEGDGVYVISYRIPAGDVQRVTLTIPATAESVRVLGGEGLFVGGDTYVVVLEQDAGDAALGDRTIELTVKGISGVDHEGGEIVLTGSGGDSRTSGVGRLLP